MKTKLILKSTVCFLFFISAFSVLAATLNSPLAGTWYKKSPSNLKKQLNNYLNNAEKKDIKKPKALILPHAGYRFSGQTAAYGIKEIVGKEYSRVIILGPSHRAPLKNHINLPNYDAYKTPLGKVKVDKQFIKQMKQEIPGKYISQKQIHHNEHSIQIQLPFLQYALKNKFKIVPVLVGNLSYEATKQIGNKLKNLVDESTLIVVSSDFTHYGRRFNYLPFPVNSQTGKKIKNLDMNAINKIININPSAFYNLVKNKGLTICGFSPITILLNFLNKDAKAELLDYSRSGTEKNNFRTSVSYASIIFSENKENKQEKGNNSIDISLTIKDKKKLLELARKTIKYKLENGNIPSPDKLDLDISKNMKQVAGAFVTLHKNGRLRGCIGEIQPRRPIYKAVMHQAVNAALNDHRFPPLNEKELSSVKIEISVLTPPRELDSYKDIKIGRDGIIISLFGRSAVYLPHVATEQGWNLKETLNHLCRKASLPSKSWKKENMTFKTFQAIVFEE